MDAVWRVEAVLRSCCKKSRKQAVEAVTSDSYTALHYAAAVGSEEIVRLLPQRLPYACGKR